LIGSTLTVNSTLYTSTIMFSTLQGNDLPLSNIKVGTLQSGVVSTTFLNFYSTTAGPGQQPYPVLTGFQFSTTSTSLTMGNISPAPGFMSSILISTMGAIWKIPLEFVQTA
jgi:hypothetical protein